MAIFKLGSEEIDIPVMNFRKIKKAWPLFRQAANIDENDPMASFDCAIKAIMVALEGTPHAELTFDVIEERLEGPQVIAVQGVLSEIMKESGLVRVKSDRTIVGNVQPGESQPPSTETLTPSSQNSLPRELKEEAGAE